jgi:hypothetical protein
VGAGPAGGGVVVTADEPARGVNLQKALEQAVSDGPRTHWFFACGCTWASTCAACERAIDAADYERRYGNPDDFDPDR